MSIWRAACERAGRTSARVPDATRCGGESSEAVITHKRLFGVCLVLSGVAGFPPNRQTPSACAGRCSPPEHTPSALCAALQSYRSSRYLQSYRSHALMSRSLRVPPQQLQSASSCDGGARGRWLVASDQRTDCGISARSDDRRTHRRARRRGASEAHRDHPGANDRAGRRRAQVCLRDVAVGLRAAE